MSTEKLLVGVSGRVASSMPSRETQKCEPIIPQMYGALYVQYKIGLVSIL